MISFNMYNKRVLINFCIIDFVAHIYNSYPSLGANTAYSSCLDSTYRLFMCATQAWRVCWVVPEGGM